MKGKRTYSKILTALGVLAFWLAVWLLLSLSVNSSFLFPSPVDTVKALGALASDAEFFAIAGITLGRIVLGVLVSFSLKYILPLIEGECYPEYKNGLPVFFEF